MQTVQPLPEFPANSPVLHDSLPPQNQTVETWLQTEVAAAYDALQADPSRAISIAQLRANLAARRNNASDATL